MEFVKVSSDVVFLQYPSPKKRHHRYGHRCVRQPVVCFVWLIIARRKCFVWLVIVIARSMFFVIVFVIVVFSTVAGLSTVAGGG